MGGKEMNVKKERSEEERERAYLRGTRGSRFFNNRVFYDPGRVEEGEEWRKG